MPEPENGRRHLKHLTNSEGRGGPRKGVTCPQLGKNQCAYCKEEGHWAKECPKEVKSRETVINMTIKEDSD